MTKFLPKFPLKNVFHLIILEWPGVDPIITSWLVKSNKLIRVHPVSPGLGASVRNGKCHFLSDLLFDTCPPWRRWGPCCGGWARPRKPCHWHRHQPPDSHKWARSSEMSLIRMLMMVMLLAPLLTIMWSQMRDFLPSFKCGTVWSKYGRAQINWSKHGTALIRAACVLRVSQALGARLSSELDNVKEKMHGRVNHQFCESYP